MSTAIQRRARLIAKLLREAKSAEVQTFVSWAALMRNAASELSALEIEAGIARELLAAVSQEENT